MNGGANGKGSMIGGGALNSVDDGGIEMMAGPPAEGVGMKVGNGDSFLVILLRPWRSVQSPSRNFWSFKM